jgi:hypothetical protein
MRRAAVNKGLKAAESVPQKRANGQGFLLACSNGVNLTSLSTRAYTR